jgi:hypothetical protein
MTRVMRGVHDKATVLDLVVTLLVLFMLGALVLVGPSCSGNAQTRR